MKQPFAEIDDPGAQFRDSSGWSTARFSTFKAARHRCLGVAGALPACGSPPTSSLAFADQAAADVGVVVGAEQAHLPAPVARQLRRLRSSSRHAQQRPLHRSVVDQRTVPVAFEREDRVGGFGGIAGWK